MAKVTVADSGPLIALAKVDLLRLLPEVFGQVLIPPHVEREALARHSEDSRRLAASIGGNLEVRALQTPTEAEFGATHYLDIGEAQAVCLAHQLGAPLFIDELKWRKAAKQLSIPVAGTVAILVAAKKMGLVPEVLPILADLRLNGYWLAQSLFERAAALADEFHT